MDIYPTRHFHITIVNFGIADVHFHKQQKGGEVKNTPKEVFYIEHDRFSYPSGANADNSNISVHDVRHKPFSDHLERMAEHKAIMKKCEKKFKKDWCEVCWFPVNVKTHAPAFLQTLQKLRAFATGI